MTQINLPFDIQPGQLEDISQVMANLEAIVAVINGGLGNDNMTPGAPVAVDKIQGGPPGTTLVTGPTGVPSWQPAGGMPPGVIVPFAGEAAPAGFLLCDGTPANRAIYADLFAVVQEKYGAGDGVNTFGIPNLKGRIPVGKDAAQGEFDAVGENGGVKSHPLSIAELPSHKHGGGVHGHGVSDPTHSHSGWTDSQGSHNHGTESGHTFAVNALINAGATGTARNTVEGEVMGTNYAGAHSHAVGTNPSGTGIGIANSGEVVGAEGGGAGHPNLQPYLVVNYLIKT